MNLPASGRHYPNPFYIGTPTITLDAMGRAGRWPAALRTMKLPASGRHYPRSRYIGTPTITLDAMGRAGRWPAALRTMKLPASGRHYPDRATSARPRSRWTPWVEPAAGRLRFVP